MLPALAAAVLVAVSGFVAAFLAGLPTMWAFLPLGAGLLLYLLDGLPSRVKGLLVVLIALTGGAWLAQNLSGIVFLFALLLSAGAFVVSIGCLYRGDIRIGFYPVLAVMLSLGHLDVAGDKSRPKSPVAGGFHHKNREVAAWVRVGAHPVRDPHWRERHVGY